MKALFAGSFDPFTLGHFDVASRASSLFDQLIVGVAQDNMKQSAPISKRMEIAAASLKSLPNVSVLPYSGLTCDFAKKNDCGVIVRGMRSPLDFAHESDLAYFSKEQADIETILLLSVRPHISSTLVRELIRLGNKFDAYVIKEAKELIKAAYIQ